MACSKKIFQQFVRHFEYKILVINFYFSIQEMLRQIPAIDCSGGYCKKKRMSRACQRAGSAAAMWNRTSPAAGVFGRKCRMEIGSSFCIHHSIRLCNTY